MRITALYRHPIKSARAQSLQHASLDTLGFVDDRRMMLIDEAGRFVTGRKFAQLTRCEVRREQDSWHVTHPDRSSRPLIFDTTPGELVAVELWGDEFAARVLDEQAGAWFSDLLGTPLRLVAQAAETHRALKAEFADPTRETVFADAFPLLIATQASLEVLNLALEDPVDMLRFRPNIVVDADLAWEEDSWLELEIGTLTFSCAKPCVRCSLVGVDPVDGTRRAEALRTVTPIRRDASFGINLVHSAPGEIAVGDEVRVSKQR